MNQTINANRLFWASCFALITTAFSFSIRAGILTQLGTELNLDTVGCFPRSRYRYSYNHLCQQL